MHCSLFFVFAQVDFCGWLQFAAPLFIWTHPTASVPSKTQLETLDMAQFEMGTGWHWLLHFCMHLPCWLGPNPSLSSQLAVWCFPLRHWKRWLRFFKAQAPLVPDVHSHQLLTMASVSSNVTSLWGEAGWNHCTQGARAQSAWWTAACFHGHNWKERWCDRQAEGFERKPIIPHQTWGICGPHSLIRPGTCCSLFAVFVFTVFAVEEAPSRRSWSQQQSQTG